MEQKSAVGYDEKLQTFSKMISTQVMQGFTVYDRNDKNLVAVLGKPGGKVNHLLHCVISIFSCGFWIIVWAYLIFSKAKEQRLRISIDNNGNVVDETIEI
jgi:hypothetical protein